MVVDVGKGECLRRSSLLLLVDWLPLGAQEIKHRDATVTRNIRLATASHSFSAMPFERNSEDRIPVEAFSIGVVLHGAKSMVNKLPMGKLR
jgi:hypothetical protein